MKKYNNIYCNSLTEFSRFKTREVLVGSVAIGGENPIRIQSMTTTKTSDTKKTVEQSIKMIDAGCELIRLTAPNIKEAKSLYDIKNELIKKGYQVPLIADIHFTPNAAIEAAKIVEKVRINPGNFSDKKKFQIQSYSKSKYLEELKKIEEKLTPLIDVCKTHKTAMRIGTNHGSLSDRIMSQYGDSPVGMVESALEFVRICEKLNYHEIVLSMKASNTIVMTQAYRLLVNKMIQENMNYPIHLGVTEAGEGDDGRIKSAVGIGSLLMDGIGDTIRVSLTEPPEKEIPVAEKIRYYINKRKKHGKIPIVKKNPINPFSYTRRQSKSIFNIGDKNPPVVVSDFSWKKNVTRTSLLSIGYRYISSLDKWHQNERSSDYVFMGNNKINFVPPGSLAFIYNYEKWQNDKMGYPMLSVEQYQQFSKGLSKKLNFVKISLDDLDLDLLAKLRGDATVVIVLVSKNTNNVTESRRAFIELINNNVMSPVILEQTLQNLNKTIFQINVSIGLGPLLLDGLGDGLFVLGDSMDPAHTNNVLFNILQATRTRISKTEYISCPSCGRTLFNLEKTTSRIREKTSHLKGLKIGIMGCIVNGPGEMADADYGYVGTGPNKVSLYKGQKMIKKNIKTKNAIEELIELIKDGGDWAEPKI